MRIYEHQGEKFEISKPEDCRVEVRSRGLVGEVVVDEETGTFRESLKGRNSEARSMDEAVERVCARIIRSASRPSIGDLCKEMDAFYDKLS